MTILVAFIYLRFYVNHQKVTKRPSTMMRLMTVRNLSLIHIYNQSRRRNSVGGKEFWPAAKESSFYTPLTFE